MFQTFTKLNIAKTSCCLSSTFCRNFFSRSKKTNEEKEKIVEKLDFNKRKMIPGHDAQSIKQRLNTLRMSNGLTTKRPYKPPTNVEDRIEKIIKNFDLNLGGKNITEILLTDSALKFKLCTAFIIEFNHDIPSSILTEMKTIEDCIVYFKTEIKQSNRLEDFKNLDLPQNLSINYEYKRFDTETDEMFDGVTAFPGSDTYIRSLKYKRKYKNIITTEKKPGYANHYYGY